MLKWTRFVPVLLVLVFAGQDLTPKAEAAFTLPRWYPVGCCSELTYSGTLKEKYVLVDGKWVATGERMCDPGFCGA